MRIAESLARMQLQPEATQAHVRRAVDLFKVSTMDAVRSGIMDHLVRRPHAMRPLHAPRACSRLSPGLRLSVCAPLASHVRPLPMKLLAHFPAGW